MSVTRPAVFIHNKCNSKFWVLASTCQCFFLKCNRCLQKKHDRMHKYKMTDCRSEQSFHRNTK